MYASGKILSPAGGLGLALQPDVISNRAAWWRRCSEAWTSLSGCGVRELALCTRQLALLLSAGLTIGEALATAGEQGHSRAMRCALRRVQAAVAEGSSLHQAFAAVPEVFDRLFCGLVRSGESGGRLDLAFTRLSGHYEDEWELERKMITACLYPAVVLCIGVSVAVLLLLFIIPQFAAFYHDFSGGEAALPAPTRTLFSLSAWLIRHWWVPVIAIPASLVLARLRLPGWVHSWLDPLLHRVPVFGALVYRSAVTRFARASAELLRAGVPLLEALDVARETCGNLVVTRRTQHLTRMLCAGEPLPRALRRARLFRSASISLIAAGHDAGNLPQACESVADMHRREIQLTVGALVDATGPLLMGVVGAVVGLVVVALYLPIFNIVDVVK